MTISAGESKEDGYFLAWAENDETGKKAIAESNTEGEAMSYVLNVVREVSDPIEPCLSDETHWGK
jgi:hypothetical protein